MLGTVKTERAWTLREKEEQADFHQSRAPHDGQDADEEDPDTSMEAKRQT